VGEVIPVGSLRPIWTAHKTLGGHIPERPSCGGFMPTAETTLIPASGNQRAAKTSLTSDARLDNEPILVGPGFRDEAASEFGASLANRAQKPALDHKHRHLDLGPVARPMTSGRQRR
jgi:hypothetical protein